MSKIIDEFALTGLLRQGNNFLEAGRYMERAQSEARDLKTTAETEGYEAGYEAGRALIAQKIAEINDEFRIKRQELETSLTDIVFACLNRVLEDIPVGFKVAAQLRKAINDSPTLTAITVKVPHEELPAMRSIIMRSGDQRLSSIQIEGDTLLKAGDILLETPQGRVHIGLQDQLDRIRRTMRRSEENTSGLE